ncbi:TonB-dependent receptor [Sphingomonas azotifigens]|uniref:TonB-dependent receptor n=1 Tax=Sphingomonas azotifigens TaxID=330920 RepID=UPI000A060452|nr:TonB-dependent receptor [Sphingomonas azotifigens]
MGHWNKRIALLLGGGTVALIAHSNAVAATPREDAVAASVADTDEQTREPEAIVVTGQRAAIKAAQEEQVKNRSLVTIVSGEELRAQPQQNLADLLTRLPGLSASVDQSYNAAATGESQYVTIRGLDSTYNAYQFDGVRLAQTDQNNRAISMNVLSPFSLAQVRVDKAPTASQDGDALAGVIDFRPATAFDLPEHYVKIRLQGQIAGRAVARDQDPWGGAAQIETAQRFGNLGVYASAYYGKKKVYSESVALHKDYVLYQNNGGKQRDNLNNLMPRGVEWNVFQNDIERFGGTLNLDWKSDNLDLYSHTTYGEYRLKSWMDQVAIRQVDLSSGQINPNPGGKGMYDAQGYAAIYGTGASNYFRTEHSNQQMVVSKLGGEARMGDHLTLDFYGAYSRGKTSYPFRLQAKFQTPAYIGPNATGPATFRLVTQAADRINPQVVLDSTAAAYLNNLANYKETYSIVQFEHATDSKGEGGFDATYKLAERGLSSIQAGAKYESSDRDSNHIDESLEYDFTSGVIPTLDKVAGSRVNDFMRGGAQVPIVIPDHNFIEGQARQLSLSQLATVNPTVLQQNLLQGTEQRASGYLLATLDFGNLSVIPGVRFEHNRFRATYWAQDGDTGGFATSSKSYDEWLPSLIASYRPDEATVYRFAVRKSYTRPPFALLLGPTQKNYDTQIVNGVAVKRLTSITVSNPNLRATTAWNVDASFEKKGAGSDLFSIAAYYKRLNNVMFSTSTDTTILPADQGLVGPDGVTINMLDTSGKGSVYGAEAFARFSPKGLPGLLDGLGVQGSVTVQHAESTIKVTSTQRATRRMPNAPELMFNAGLFYNHGAIAAAVDYTYSGKKLIDVRDPQPDTYLQPTSNMNASINYSFHNGLTAGVSVQNVLDSHAYWATYGSGKGLLSVDRSGGYIEAGRTYMLNLSYAF